MESPVDQQRLAEYQNRVSEWIGKQGFLFQLQNASTVGSRTILRHISVFGVKIAITLLFIAIGGFFFLRSYFQSEGYQDKIAERLTEGLGAEVDDFRGFERSAFSADFRNLKLVGGEESFFTQAEIRRMTSPFYYLDGVATEWSPETVTMDVLLVTLKAGGRDMTTAVDSVIESLDARGLTSLRVQDFSCDWGYSKLTYGKIDHAQLRATLKDGCWEIQLTGGTFQQNWLGPVEIEEALVVVDQNGLELKSFSANYSGSRLWLRGEITGPARRPEFKLRGDFENLPFEDFLRIDGIQTEDYLEGRISGSLKIGGSSNRGITFSGKAEVAEGGMVTIREKWPLLRALSIIDGSRTYMRLDFNEGGFSFETSKGCMKLTDVDLTSPENARLTGSLETELPTQQEAADALGIKLTKNFTPEASNDVTDIAAARKLEMDRMSIRNRSLDDQGRFVELGASDGSGEIDQRIRTGKDLEEKRLRDEMEVHRINGELRLAVPATAFDEGTRLDAAYPSDEDNWRWIKVVLENHRFTEISEAANEDLLRLSKADREDGNN